MPGRIGIAIATYNRKDLVRETVRAVRSYTRRNDVDFVVADDGSSDGTVAMLRDDDVPVVTGVNMGVAWNKNRALYLLGQVLRCEAVILLEDDTMPSRIGWEDVWIDAASRWDHANYAGDWLADKVVSGSGIAADPFLAEAVTAQCAVYSRQALDWGGYFDPRFRGYGHEHVEHSRRLVRIGCGGRDQNEKVLFAQIKGDLDIRPTVSHANREQAASNLEIAHQAMSDHGYRVPWRTIAEMRQFRSEIKSAIEARPHGFALRPAATASAGAGREGRFSLTFLFRKRA